MQVVDTQLLLTAALSALLLLGGLASVASLPWTAAELGATSGALVRVWGAGRALFTRAFGAPPPLVPIPQRVRAQRERLA